MIDLSQYGSSDPFKWSQSKMMKLLTQGANPLLSDNLLINSFRQINREDFIPEDHQHLTYLDKNVPIGYGETLTSPYTLAQLLNILSPQLEGEYLELGSGTGYLAAILGHTVGPKGKVYGLERVQWLWEQSRENLRKYDQIQNVELLYRDGVEGLRDKASFTGIISSFTLAEIPMSLREQLKVGGKLIVPTPNHQLRVVERLSDQDYIEEIVPDFSALNFGVMKPGRA